MTLGTTPNMSHSFDGSTTSTAVVYIHESTINKQREREREREREKIQRDKTHACQGVGTCKNACGP
jgi:hypothetical protein